MSTNTDEQIAVIWLKGEWRIIQNGIARAHFDYQVDAEHAARQMADTACAEGRTAELLIQDRFGEVETAAIFDGRSKTSPEG